MKFKLEVIAILFLCCYSFALSPVTSRVCGGEGGPTPLINLKNYFPEKYTQIETQGPVSEYLFWENKNQVVYRNTLDLIFSKKLSESLTDSLISVLNVPISRVTDPFEKYLMVKDDSRYLDTSEPIMAWQKFSTQYPITEHLFWATEYKENVLYSMSSTVSQNNALQEFYIHRYATKQKDSSMCKLQVKPGEKYYLGKGHEFPHVFLYKTTKQANNRTKVEFFKIAVNQSVLPCGDMEETCKISPVSGVALWITGNVKEVYYLPGNHNGVTDFTPTFAVRTDHPESNLYWIYKSKQSEPVRCLALNFHGREHFVLNKSHSLITTWSEEEGIQLVMPQLKIYSSIFSNLKVTGLKEEDFLLSDKGKLFVAAENNSVAGKELFLSDLSQHFKP